MQSLHKFLGEVCTTVIRTASLESSSGPIEGSWRMQHLPYLGGARQRTSAHVQPTHCRMCGVAAA